MTTMVIGPAHAAVVAALHGACFDVAWDERACGDLLAMPATYALLAQDPSGAPIGFVMMSKAADEAEVLSIAVLPTARRDGVATGLLNDALAAMRAANTTRVFLEVAVDNTAAKTFYENRRFQPVGRRKGYYARGDGAVDALVLACDL